MTVRPVLVRGGFCFSPAVSLSIHHSGEHCNAFVPTNPGLDRAYRNGVRRGPPVRFRHADVRFRTDPTDSAGGGAPRRTASGIAADSAVPGGQRHAAVDG